MRRLLLSIRRPNNLSESRFMTSPITLPVGFSEENGSLFCEGVALDELARRYGTPLYVYSRKAIETTVADYQRELVGTDHRVFFAMKANSNLGILDLLNRLGCGFDIVSGGELARALAAGADARKVVYSGVGKTEDEMRQALTAGILCFNIESIPELDRLQSVAASMGVIANISVRINPNVDPKTHPYISTGLKNNKFGVAYDDTLALYKKAASLPNIRVTGIDCHIGSQITELAPFVDAAHRILDMVDALKNEGIELDHIDFGGGLGVQYIDETPPAACELVKALIDLCQQRGYGHLTLYFEPGRSLIARAGVLLMTVQYLKPTEAKNFCIVDAGMNDMMRPALYQAEMPIVPTVRRDGTARTWDIVGPICESGDWLDKERALTVAPGDTLAMFSAGAYGMSMASNYNSRPGAAEVLVSGTDVQIIRERQTYDDLMRHEKRLAE